jgi:hypothetical protein
MRVPETLGLRFHAGAPALVAAILAGAACTAPPPPPPPRPVVAAVARKVGSWQGTGNTMVGFISDTGRFRIHWEARDEHPPERGAFRLTVRSGVSGRPLEVVVDHRGEGRGTTVFEDDPRIYDLAVESTDAHWSFAVEELMAVYGDQSSPQPPKHP